MKKIIILLSLLLLTSCTNNNQIYKKDKYFLGYTKDKDDNMVLLLNSEVNLTIVNNGYKETLINTAKDTITKYHKLLDSNHYYLDENGKVLNNIKVLNDNINKGIVEVDPIIIDALKESIKLTKLTNGYFNITLGKLSNLYKDKFLSYDSINTDPDKSDIDKTLLGIISYDKLEDYIILDETNNTVELKTNDNPYLIDLGAFSKGYILSKVYDELIKYNTSFLLTAGSSSIITYTNRDENVNWNIALKDPNTIDSQLLVFNLDNGAVSTSGDYENYYLLEDGTRRHHILNPYSGHSENYYRSISLLSNNAGIIDALSTALFNISNKNDIKHIISNIENNYNTKIAYSILDNDNNLFINNYFNDTLQEQVNRSINITVE